MNAAWPGGWDTGWMGVELGGQVGEWLGREQGVRGPGTYMDVL